MTARHPHRHAFFDPRSGALAWTLAAGCGALLTFAVLASVEGLADLSAAVHLMA